MAKKKEKGKKKQTAAEALLSRKSEFKRPRAKRKVRIPKKTEPQKREFEDPLSFCTNEKGFNPDITFTDAKYKANGEIDLGDIELDF